MEDVLNEFCFKKPGDTYPIYEYKGWTFRPEDEEYRVVLFIETGEQYYDESDLRALLESL